jgi:drug/metabolite transporter (DMT)-like permease
MTRDPRNFAGIAAVLLASAIWGGSFVLAKFAMVELPVPHVVLYRFLFAAVPMLPFLLRSRSQIARKDIPLFLLTGFLMVPVTIFLQFVGLELAGATSTALMVGVGTPLLAVAGVIFEKEVLGRRGWSAAGLSSVGVVLLVGSPGEGDNWIGSLLVFASIVISVVWVLTSKRLVQRYPAFFATGWIVVFGTGFLIPISLLWSGAPRLDLSGTVWVSLVGLGVGCTTFAYAMWNWGVSRIGAASAGSYLNLEPMTGALLGIVILDDPVNIGIITGGGLILTAAMMTSTAAQPGAVPEREMLPLSPLAADWGPGTNVPCLEVGAEPARVGVVPFRATIPS